MVVLSCIEVVVGVLTTSLSSLSLAAVIGVPGPMGEAGPVASPTSPRAASSYSVTRCTHERKFIGQKKSLMWL